MAKPRSVNSSLINGEIQLSFWDNPENRLLILNGPEHVGEAIDLDALSTTKPLVIFDEIHKYENWKDFLKGFFDLYQKKAAILVTGSACLDIFRKSGDSLMGRYFSYRMHPFTIGEVVRKKRAEEEFVSPKRISVKEFDNLLQYGGFPEPFLKANMKFYRKWKTFRFQQLFQEEIRDLTKIQHIDIMEILAHLIQHQVGQLTTCSSLARKLRKTSVTVQSWLSILKNLYFCFDIKPWTKNVTRSLLKEPKYYLWDWSFCEDEGAGHENLVASHLLKAIHFWTDCGLGEYELYYLRDKEKREVDFLISKENQPWMAIEVKSSNNKPISKALRYFQKELNIPYAFQVVFDLPFVQKDCFQSEGLLKVLATTFLSQLV